MFFVAFCIFLLIESYRVDNCLEGRGVIQIEKISVKPYYKSESTHAFGHRGTKGKQYEVNVSMNVIEEISKGFCIMTVSHNKRNQTKTFMNDPFTNEESFDDLHRPHEKIRSNKHRIDLCKVRSCPIEPSEIEIHKIVRFPRKIHGKRNVKIQCFGTEGEELMCVNFSTMGKSRRHRRSPTVREEHEYDSMFDEPEHAYQTEFEEYTEEDFSAQDSQKQSHPEMYHDDFDQSPHTRRHHPPRPHPRPHPHPHPHPHPRPHPRPHPKPVPEPEPEPTPEPTPEPEMDQVSEPELELVMEEEYQPDQEPEQEQEQKQEPEQEYAVEEEIKESVFQPLEYREEPKDEPPKEEPQTDTVVVKKFVEQQPFRRWHPFKH
ncbi:uncharacterized protein MONOS_99 [Monocercomonoides exilis]|uniref:uncharacterized protein n=1 Tax=Monocercomonoides exilis TaxID=2049356 RepID=UPI003559CB2E|nr:hypothetical protein MONOS_99 [Monocercomonoides exilis]|eukprot:MONOS_99.1-p1 / transcript=MONOS_99.1 / gene=MONOS_99 / organism=Monocercomonoides_exilis_PA203 / gene_product=unspecified product / transcript_product=unspecified product / location=Mono_scaffold00002:71228-72349(+) / protein_length=374 / sequence_SO=supercontig / SO=protein_coding / is_pseudo=false